MSKLLKLKEWLPLDEAAHRLTMSAGELVTEADIIRFAIDFHLTLSIFIDESVDAREVAFETEHSDETIRLFLGERSTRATAIDGVWDITATAQGARELERLYRKAKGIGAKSYQIPLEDGIFLCTPGKEVVMELLDPQLNFQVITHEEHQEADEGGRLEFHRKPGFELTDTHQAELSSLLKDGLGKICPAPVIQDTILSYYQAKKLPEECLLVVRTDELLAFEAEQLAVDSPREKPLHISERRSLGQIIATLAAMNGLDLSTPYAADETLRAAAASFGLELPSSPGTVTKHLKEAAAGTSKA